MEMRKRMEVIDNVEGVRVIYSSRGVVANAQGSERAG